MAICGPGSLQLSARILRGGRHPQVLRGVPGTGAAGPSKGVRKGRLPPAKEVPASPHLPAQVRSPVGSEEGRGLLVLAASSFCQARYISQIIFSMCQGRALLSSERPGTVEGAEGASRGRGPGILSPDGPQLAPHPLGVCSLSWRTRSQMTREPQGPL